MPQNIEPAATKEMHTVELREANSAGDDATDRNIKDHVGNGSIEKAKDAHQVKAKIQSIGHLTRAKLSSNIKQISS